MAPVIVYVKIALSEIGITDYLTSCNSVPIIELSIER